jgi:hypothetical protein
VLVDVRGLPYTRGRGVAFALTGPNFSSACDSAGVCRAAELPERLALTATAGNAFFNLSARFERSAAVRLAPENAVLLKGTTAQFQCSAPRPRWDVRGDAVANVSRRGLVTAIREGAARLSCAPGADTSVTVVTLRDLEMRRVDTAAEFEVRPRFSSAGAREVRHDLTLACHVLNASFANCGLARAVVNGSGWFCVVDDDARCGFKTVLRAIAESATAKVRVVRDANVSRRTVAFGIDREVWKIMRGANRTATIPLKLRSDEVRVNASKGLSLAFVAGEERAVIQADRTFKAKGRVDIQHLETGEKAVVHVELLQDVQAPPFVHERDFPLGQDLVFSLCLVALFVCIAAVVFALNSAAT